MRWLASTILFCTVAAWSQCAFAKDDKPFRFQPGTWHGSTPGYAYGYGSGMGQGLGYGQSPYYAGKGLICDRVRRACFDRYGYDYFATQYYFGNTSDYVSPYLGGAPYWGDGSWPRNLSRAYSPRSGIVCERESKTCADERGMDAHWTGREFGDSFEERVEDWRAADAFRPLQGIVCDNRRRVCASQHGIERGWTKFYFGENSLSNFRIIDDPRPYFGADKFKPVTP